MFLYILLTVVLLLLLDIRFNLLKQKQPKYGSTVVMDTSALIDARILDIVKSGFVISNIVISKTVLDELQLIADGRDAHKRERARLGLDIVSELQQLKTSTVIIYKNKAIKDQTTDESVLLLAKKLKASLCTTDYNLNKVAVAEGVTVLNVNELAQVMRPKILPGEKISVKILQKGEGIGQGVGYLDDGTMTVVEGAFKMRGQTVTATVDRMIQTKAGKMIFANISKN
ncbi:MAG: hypothetical protein Q7T41_00775 [Candidatus Saccharibacteria bacterium]|nr:hypothetical protein [Candidatus Saccharibacteria bacterium]